MEFKISTIQNYCIFFASLLPLYINDLLSHLTRYMMWYVDHGFLVDM